MFSMLTGLPGLLLNPKMLIRMALIAAALFLAFKIWGFVDTAFENAQKVIEQEVVIQLKDHEITALTIAAEQAKEAELIAERARIFAEERASELRQIRDAALAAGDEFDGTLAPVLSDTLRALRERMQ